MLSAMRRNDCPRWAGICTDDSAIMNFLTSYVGKFDLYVEDEYATFVRYCFEDPLDAAIFRSRFEHRYTRLKLAS